MSSLVKVILLLVVSAVWAPNSNALTCACPAVPVDWVPVGNECQANCADSDVDYTCINGNFGTVPCMAGESGCTTGPLPAFCTPTNTCGAMNCTGRCWYTTPTGTQYADCENM